VASLAKQVSVGENIYDFIDPQDHGSLKRCLRKVMGTGEGARFESSQRVLGQKISTQVNPIKNQGHVVALTMWTNRK
jgi:hypothetical protein